MFVNFAPSKKQFLAWSKLHPNDHTTEYVLFGGGSNGGKTWLGCEWLLYMAMKYPGTRWFIGREELKRLRESTLVTFYKMCKHYGIKTEQEFRYDGQDNYFDFRNGSTIHLLDLRYLPSDPLYERYGSIEYTGGFLEECGEVNFGAYDTLKARINRHLNDEYNLLGKMLLTCNPKKNWLYHEFYKPWKRGELPPNKAFIQSLWGDNPYREKGSENKLSQIKNTATKERLYYGNWDYSDEPDQLIPYDLIEKALNVSSEMGPKRLGVDPAQYGDDESVICLIEGNTIIKTWNYAKMSLTELSRNVGNIIDEYKLDPEMVAVDSDGLGAGVCDNLKDEGFDIVVIKNGSSPLQMDTEYTFKNKRSQMWWYAMRQLEDEKINLSRANPALFDDLTTPKYSISGDKYFMVESKDQMKKRLNRSPDYADAFIYALFLDCIHEKTEISDIEIW